MKWFSCTVSESVCRRHELARLAATRTGGRGTYFKFNNSFKPFDINWEKFKIYSIPDQ